MTTDAGRARLDPGALATRAAQVLRDNDLGHLVTAAPTLYPHMWSWDAAFVALGLAHIDLDRAILELETLFAAQWRDGMVPHIVFTDGADYFPGPERWGTDTAAGSPDHVRTSGICQPPVHAIAVRRILDTARDGSPDAAARAEEFTRRIWPAVHDWHRWLAEHRVPDASGLVAIVHGWESGMDNSPRWDLPYAAVLPGPTCRPTPAAT